MSYRELRDNLEKAMNGGDPKKIIACKQALSDLSAGKAPTMVPDRSEPEMRGTFGETKPKKPSSRRSTPKPK